MKRILLTVLVTLGILYWLDLLNPAIQEQIEFLLLQVKNVLQQLREVLDIQKHLSSNP